MAPGAEVVEHGFGAVRGEPEDCAATVCAATRRGAVQIARAIHDQAGQGVLAIGTIGPGAKGMEHVVSTVGRNLEDVTTALCPAIPGRAVEIAGTVHDHTSLRRGAVAAIASGAEAVEHGLPAAGVSAAVRANHCEREPATDKTFCAEIKNPRHLSSPHLGPAPRGQCCSEPPLPFPRRAPSLPPRKAVQILPVALIERLVGRPKVAQPAD